MPGEANIVSGLAGMASVPQGGGDQGPDVLQLVNAVKQIKMAEQKQAQDTLTTALDIGAKTGMYPSEKDFAKLAKAAGVPIEGIQAIAGGVAGGGPTPQQVTKTGSAIAPNAGAQAANPPSASAAAKAPGGGVVQTVPAGTGTVEKGVAATNQSPYEQMVASTRQRLADTAMSEHQRQVLDQHITNLKLQAEQGDGQALGKLMAMGGVNLSADQATFAMANPEQKQKIIDIASGQESPAQKELRVSNMTMDLFKSGRFASVADARSAAEGKTVAMQPDLGRMVDEAKFTNELLNTGLSFDQAKDVGIKMANGVSLADALPTGVTPLVQQQMALEKRKVAAAETTAQAEVERTGVEAQRVQAEIARTNKETELAAQKMILDLQERDDKEFNSRFDNYVNMKRAKVSVDPSFEENMINELAARSGMIPEKVRQGLNWLTFGMLGRPGYEFKPAPGSTQPPGSAGAPQVGTTPTKPSSAGVTPLNPHETIGLGPNFNNPQSLIDVMNAVGKANQ